jgi:glycosyltransferase involved in cell wall biosynthesis
VTAPECSVVVCTRDRARRVARCLDAVARLDHPSFEVVLVDNTPGDPAVRHAAHTSGARYVVEPRGGLSRARNTGARAAQGAIVAFTDDDATPAPDWLSRHAAALRDPALSATTGRVVPAAPDSETGRAYLAAGAEDLGSRPYRVSRSTPLWFEMAHFGGVGIGPNMAFRRSLFERGWGFRADLGPADGLPGEEHFAFYSLIRAGHVIAYVPESVVEHDVPPTMAALDERRRRIARGAAAYLMMLIVEEPGCRRGALRFAWTALRGKRRSWRPTPAQQPLVPRRELAAVAVAGPVLYLRWRTRRAATPAADRCDTRETC